MRGKDSWQKTKSTEEHGVCGGQWGRKKGKNARNSRFREPKVSKHESVRDEIRKQAGWSMLSLRAWTSSS